MGNRNYLHVCQSCGNVVATSSTTGPRSCFNCEESMFSLYEPPEGVAGSADRDR